MGWRMRTTTLGITLSGLLTGIFGLGGCSASNTAGGAAEGLIASEGGDSGGGGSSSSANGSGGGSGGQAGVLTAGIWDDNLNYTFFKTYLASHQGQNAIAGDPGFAAADYDAS